MKHIFSKPIRVNWSYLFEKGSLYSIFLCNFFFKIIVFHSESRSITKSLFLFSWFRLQGYFLWESLFIWLRSIKTISGCRITIIHQHYNWNLNLNSKPNRNCRKINFYICKKKMIFNGRISKYLSTLLNHVVFTKSESCRKIPVF